MAGTHRDETTNTVRGIGRRLTEATGDQRETSWLTQRLSLALQHGNDASIFCGERGRQIYFGNRKTFKIKGEVLVGQAASLTPHADR